MTLFDNSQAAMRKVNNSTQREVALLLKKEGCVDILVRCYEYNGMRKLFYRILHIFHELPLFFPVNY